MTTLTRFTMCTAAACLMGASALAQVAPIPVPAPRPAAEAAALELALAQATKAAQPSSEMLAAIELELARVGRMPVEINALALAEAERALAATRVAGSDVHVRMGDVALALEMAAVNLQAAQSSGSQSSEEAKRAQERAERDDVRARERAKRAAESASRSGYARGTAALDAGRWAQARDAFAEAVRAGYRADGALYWKAYAEYKLAERAAAIESLRELQKAYPSSRWLREARALEQEMSGPAAATAGAGTDDDLKLLAINSLVNADADQAVPMLEKILVGPNSPQLKKRALFVLAQNKSPKAQDVLLATAKGSSNPDLQLDALRYLGMFGGTRNLQALSDLYSTSKDVDIKRRILETYAMSGQRDLVLQAATSEADAALREQAVRMLGVLRATAELEKLYAGETSPEIKRAIVESMMVSGDNERLLAIAKADRDPAMRLRAIEMLGAMGRGKNAVALGGIYSAEGQTKEAKRAVLNALFISGDAKTLIDIARKDPDQELRKAAVELLSMMKSKEATDYMMEIISK